MRTIRDVMTGFMYSSVKAALPLIIAPVGIVSDELIAMIEDLALSLFQMTTHGELELEAVCHQHGIPLPEDIMGQFVPCRSIIESERMHGRLLHDTALLCFQCVGRIFVVDYLINTDVEMIRQQCRDSARADEVYGLVFFRWNTEHVIASRPRECVLFQSYTQTNVVAVIQQFASLFAVGAFLRHELVRSLGKTRLPLRNAPVLVSLQLISMNAEKAIGTISTTIARYSLVSSPMEVAPMLETASLLIHGWRPEGRVIPNLSIWFDGSMDKSEPEAILCLRCAAALYLKVGVPEKAVDCWLRAMHYGSRGLVQSIASAIERYQLRPNMEMRAAEFVDLCAMNGCSRKATLYCHAFSCLFHGRASYNWELMTFKNLGLKNVGSNAISGLVIPLIRSLMKKESKPREIHTMIADVVSEAGPRLTRDVQAEFFDRLESLSVCGFSITARLHIDVQSVAAASRPFNIRPRIASRTRQTPFIHDCLSDDQASGMLLCQVDEPIRLVLDLMNPYFALLYLSLTPICVDCECKETSAFIGARSESKVTLVLTPRKAGVFVIDQLIMTLYGMWEVVCLQQKFSFMAVSGAPVITSRSDLPLTRPVDVVIGETLNFNIYVSNGRMDVDEVRIHTLTNCLIDVSGASIPLKAFDEMHLTCSMNISDYISSIDFWVVCRTADSDFETLIAYSQALNVAPGLVPTSVFAIKRTESLFIGIPIMNEGTETFIYSSDDTRDYVGSGQTKICVTCVDSTALSAETVSANGRRVIQAAAELEGRANRITSREERRVIVRLLQLSTALDKQIKIPWTTPTGRTGYIPMSWILPDANVLSALSDTPVRPTCTFTLDGSTLASIPTNKIVALTIDFGGREVHSCILDLGTGLALSAGVLWDGTLTQTSPGGQTVFIYNLCFTQPGVLQLTVHYKLGDFDFTERITVSPM